jgi:hypothetical protein
MKLYFIIYYHETTFLTLVSKETDKTLSFIRLLINLKRNNNKVINNKKKEVIYLQKNLNYY